MRIRAILAAFWLMAVPAVATPSFDCRLAATPSEITICAVPMLGDLDRFVAEAYQQQRAMLGPAGREQLKAEQRYWIGQRDRCGADTGCLQAMMQGRLQVLGGRPMAPLPPPMPPMAASSGISGVYCARDGADTLGLIERPDGIYLSLMSWQGPTGHLCTLDIVLPPNAGGGWAGMRDGCTYWFRQEGGNWVLRAQPDEVCSAGCGARARLDGLNWPLAGRRPGLPGQKISVEGPALCQ